MTDGPAISLKPPDLDAYADWLWHEHGVETALLESQYNRVSRSILNQFQTSRFWTATKVALPELISSYFLCTGYRMASSDPMAGLQVKPWETFWLKTFRRNVVDNDEWPGPPPEGWWLPNTWFPLAKDVVRTRIVVRYLDAVVEVAQLLEGIARRMRHRYATDYEATDAGYYAAHFVIRRRLDIPALAYDTTRVVVPIEIQVTTEVKSVVQELLHKYYEEARQHQPADPEEARWNYASDAFRSSYVGHMAHYLEGIIMNLRESNGAD